MNINMAGFRLKHIHIRVLWTKVASALEGLKHEQFFFVGLLYHIYGFNCRVYLTFPSCTQRWKERNSSVILILHNAVGPLTY